MSVRFSFMLFLVAGKIRWFLKIFIIFIAVLNERVRDIDILKIVRFCRVFYISVEVVPFGEIFSADFNRTAISFVRLNIFFQE
jgi:hypothetical protein